MLSSKSLKLTIFVTEIICMILELCASYLFSPYFGSSNLVWTSIIGVILMSNSIGNFIGGRIAQNKDKDYLPFIFLLAAIFTFTLGILNDVVCLFVFQSIKNSAVASLISSFILLLPSAICLGTIPPQIMTRTVGNSDKGVGIIYMLSTIGGLFGTFCGGYFLIPNIGVNIIVIVCGTILFVFGFKLTKEKKVIIALCLAVFVAFCDISMVIVSNNGILVRDKTLVFDSEYNRIMITDSVDKNGDSVRYMEMAQGFESATYTDKDKRYDLLFDYCKSVSDLIESDGIYRKDMLMIGGAAYQFPKYVIAHYDDATIDVVEIDDKVTELAKEYFYLQDCIDEFDENHLRMNLINADAKVFIKQSDKKYDMIVNDAFSGLVPVRTLTTLESIKEFKALLNDDGIYVANIIDMSNFNEGKFLKAECKTLQQVFKYVYVTQVEDDADDGISNYRVVASDTILSLDVVDIDFNDSVILTDNYCPIDSLIPNK